MYRRLTHLCLCLCGAVQSLDVACQRYATLALCNLSTGELKGSMVEQGAVRPLMFLARFPDLEIQRTAALALGGLALGNPENKVRQRSEVDVGKGWWSIVLVLFVCYAGRLSCVLIVRVMWGQMRLVEEGAVRPLVELVHFPDAAVQACSAIAINAVAIGTLHHNNLHHSGRRLNHSSAA